VNLEPNVAGVVVGVGREELTVLDVFGSARAVKPQQLRGNLNRQSAAAQAFDHDSSAVKENERVAVLAGQHRHFAENTVKRIYKATLFVYAKERAEHAGMAVARARDVRLVGRHAAAAAAASHNYMGKLDAVGGGKGGAV
jgi:transcription elongation factor